MSSRRQMLEFLSTIGPTPPGPTPIIDLTGTTWQINQSPYIEDGYYNLTFISNSNTYSSFNILTTPIRSAGICYDNTQVFFLIGEDWVDENYCIIEITGGTDVTNTDLIAWLQANATLLTSN